MPLGDLVIPVWVVFKLQTKRPNDRAAQCVTCDTASQKYDNHGESPL